MILDEQSIASRLFINPFFPRTEWKDLMGRRFTFGLGPAGYDVRVEFDSKGERQLARLEPGGFLLASTIEQFEIPADIVGVVHDKSSWARRGLAVQNTVLEPGWCGYLTLELSNHSHIPITLYRETPIAQIIFHQLVRPVFRAYGGKYQFQERGPQEAR